MSVVRSPDGSAGTAGRPRLRALFLAYFFPPVNKVGAVRTYNIAKSLARQGWDVTVVTPSASVWREVERPGDVERLMEEAGIRCIRTDHRLRFLSPIDLGVWNEGIGWAVGGVCRRIARAMNIEREAGWFPEAARVCAALAPEDVDVVIASGPPFGAFRLAQQLAAVYDCPYVLDYRDLWMGNPHVNRVSGRRAVQTEGRLLAGARAITAISQSVAESLRSQFGVSDSVHVVTNGYDDQDFAGIRPHDFGHFAIVYTGAFYRPKRVITPVMAVLQRLKEAGDFGSPWFFHYYGAHEDHVLEEARRFGVEDKVVLHGSVTRAEALAAVKGAGMAVVITSVSETGTLEERGIVTGKLFEALGLRAPILAIAPTGSDVEGILNTAGIGRRFTGDDVAGMAALLRKAVSGGALDVKHPEQYSWSAIGPNLDAVLRGVLEQHRRWVRRTDNPVPIRADR